MFNERDLKQIEKQMWTWGTRRLRSLILELTEEIRQLHRQLHPERDPLTTYTNPYDPFLD